MRLGPAGFVLRDAGEGPVVLHGGRAQEQLALLLPLGSVVGRLPLDVEVVPHVDVVDQRGPVVDVGVLVAPNHSGVGNGLQ